MSQNRLTGYSYGKASGNALRVPKLGGAGSQGITRAGRTVIIRLVETPIWCQPASSVGGGLRKGTMASA